MFVKRVCGFLDRFSFVQQETPQVV